MNESFMKQRPILPLLLTMALPMVISMLVNSLYNIVDTYYVSQISQDAMTALSLVYPVQNLINAVAIGFGVGINAVIALHLGAQERDQADQAATQGLVLSIAHGLVLAVGCIAAMPGFLSLFTASQAVVDLGVRYATVAFAFAPIIMAGLAFEKLFQAVGSMTVTMVGLMCGCLANIILDPLLIFGIGPFPALGIEGAALATGIGQTLSLALYLCVYRLRPIGVGLRRRYIRPQGRMSLRLYAIGIPAILNLALPSFLISALNAILAAYSELYILVLGAYYKLQTFLYLPANGIIQGMRPLIGYNFGAGEYERVRQIYRTVLAMIGGIMALGTLIFLLLPGPLTGLFTDSPQAIRAGESALRIISAGFGSRRCPSPPPGRWRGWARGCPRWPSPCFATPCCSSPSPSCSAWPWAQRGCGTHSGSPRCWPPSSPCSSTARRWAGPDPKGHNSRRSNPPAAFSPLLFFPTLWTANPHRSICSRAALAANCSASFLVRPCPWPATLPSTVTSMTNTRSWSGPISSTRW